MFQQHVRLVRAMEEDPGTRCLGSIYILSNLLGAVGLIYYTINNNSKAYLYLFLVALALRLFLVCCGWTIKSSMNPFANLCSILWFLSCSVLFLGLINPVVLELRSAYIRDSRVNLTVTEAALTQFSLSGNNTNCSLNYNLTLKLTVGPNKKKAGVYYEFLQAWASYQGLNFTSLSLPPFYMGGKSNHTPNSSTVVLQPLVFQGRQELLLPADALKRYWQDEAAGRFSIDLTVSFLGFRGPAGPGHGHQLKDVATFALKEIPLSNATGGWVEGNDSLSEKVMEDIVGISVSAFLLLCFLCCCWSAFKETECSNVIGTLLCMLIPIITIAIVVPDLVRALNKANDVELNVSNATLAQFNLSSSASTINSSTLSYNFSIEITVGPEHKKTGVYFSKLEATAYYQGQNLTSLALSPFYLQGRQPDGARTVILRPVFQGQQLITMLRDGDGLTQYQEETAARMYGILVILSYSGIQIDNNDYSNSTYVNETLTKAGHQQLNGVATFELKVPLLSNVSGGAVSSGAAAANIEGFSRQNGVLNFVVIPVFLMLHFCL